MSEYKSFDYTTMNEQEVFDACANHLIEQGEGCYIPRALYYEDSPCIYRGANGKQCAASIFIPTNAYHPGIENQGWLNVVKELRLSHNHYNLINKLQAAHDGAVEDSLDYPDEFTVAVCKKLGDVAIEFKLSTAVLE